MPAEVIDYYNTLPLHKHILEILIELLSFFHILYVISNILTRRGRHRQCFYHGCISVGVDNIPVELVHAGGETKIDVLSHLGQS